MPGTAASIDLKPRTAVFVYTPDGCPPPRLRYAVRALLNRPWFSALAVLTLAIGIGVNTVAYSAINALLGKPMRFPGARELGWIQTTGGKSPYNQTALPDYRDLARENRTFEAHHRGGPRPAEHAHRRRRGAGLGVAGLRQLPEHAAGAAAASAGC